MNQYTKAGKGKLSGLPTGNLQLFTKFSNVHQVISHAFGTAVAWSYGFEIDFVTNGFFGSAA